MGTLVGAGQQTSVVIKQKFKVQGTIQVRATGIFTRSYILLGTTLDKTLLFFLGRGRDLVAVEDGPGPGAATALELPAKGSSSLEGTNSGVLYEEPRRDFFAGKAASLPSGLVRACFLAVIEGSAMPKEGNRR